MACYEEGGKSLKKEKTMRGRGRGRGGGGMGMGMGGGKDGKGSSAPWSRLKPVEMDPLEAMGLPSKGDNR